MVINYLVKSILLPPGLVLVVLAASLFLLWFQPARAKLAKILLALSLVILYLFSTPWFSQVLMHRLQTIPALSKEKIMHSGAGAIVVLSSGRYANASEYGHDTVDESTMMRLRYGVYLHRLTDLPILVTGGYVLDKRGDSLAQVMEDVLRKEYGITKVWQENTSRTTAENALFAKKILDEKGIKCILLVTHAWHMPRSRAIFRKAGFDVVPAPTMFQMDSNVRWIRFFPSAGALMASYTGLHEWIGQLWYSMRYGL